MKKNILLLAAMGVLLACSTTVFAASVTQVLMPGDCMLAVPLDPNLAIHANGHGWVTFKRAQGGSVDLTIQLWDGAKLYPYVVKSAGIAIGTFTTNQNGNGGVTLHIANASTLGQYIGVWDKDLIGCSPTSNQSLWAAFNPLWH